MDQEREASQILFTVSSLGASPTTTPSVLLSSTFPASPSRRPDSSYGSNQFTVTNAQPQEIPRSTPFRQRPVNSTVSPSSGNAQRQWLTAEEEKLKFSEKARAQVPRVQGPAATATPPPDAAEEEKLRLFQQARTAVQITQRLAYIAPPTHTRNGSDSPIEASRLQVVLVPNNHLLLPLYTRKL